MRQNRMWKKEAEGRWAKKENILKISSSTVSGLPLRRPPGRLSGQTTNNRTSLLPGYIDTYTIRTSLSLSTPSLTLHKNPGDEARVPLVVDEAEVLSGVHGQHGRHVEAEVGRGEVHPLGRPQDHGSVPVVRHELGRGALLGPPAAAPKAALGFDSFHWCLCLNSTLAIFLAN